MPVLLCVHVGAHIHVCMCVHVCSCACGACVHVGACGGQRVTSSVTINCFPFYCFEIISLEFKAPLPRSPTLAGHQAPQGLPISVPPPMLGLLVNTTMPVWVLGI